MRLRVEIAPAPPPMPCRRPILSKEPEVPNNRRHCARLALVVLLAGVAGCGREPTSAEYLAKAQHYQQQGQYKEASIEARNAVKLAPDDPAGRLLLGNLYLQMGIYDAAEKELRRAHALGTAAELVNVGFGEALLALGNWQEALKLAEQLDPARASEPLRLQLLRADAELAGERLDAAEQRYRDILKQDARAARAHLGLARIAAIKGDVTAVNREIDSAAAIDSDDAELWSLKGEWQRLNGQTEAAEQSYSEALRRRPNLINDRYHRALARIVLNNPSGADEDIQLLHKQLGDHPLVAYLQGMNQFRQRHFDEAQSALEKAVRGNSRHFTSHYYLGLTHLLRNQPAQAEQYLKQALEIVPRSAAARLALALSQYRSQQHDSAAKNLTELLKQQPDDVAALNLLGEVELKRGNSAAGLRHLEAALKQGANSPAAQARLGLANLQAGRTDEGIEDLEALLKSDPRLAQASAMAALSKIQSGQLDEAAKVIALLKRNDDKGPLPDHLEGLLLIARNQPDAARAAFGRALQKEPGNPAAGQNLALLAIAARRYDEAAGHYQAVLARHPDDLQTLMGLAQLHALQGQSEPMVQRLEQAHASHPRQAEPVIALARWQQQQGEVGKARTLLESAFADSDEGQLLLRALVELEIRAKESERALAALERLDPDSLANLRFSLDSYQRLNRPDRGLALLRSVTERHPAAPAPRLLLAQWLLASNEIEQARQAFEPLRQRHPEQIEVLLFEGELARRQGKPELAVAAYQRAYKKQPGASLARALAQAQLQQGQPRAALATLEGWNRQSPNDLEALYLRAKLHGGLDEAPAARKLLEQMVAIDPNSIVALNDLAWELKTSDPQRAGRYIDQALTRSPDAAALLDTQAMVRLAQGNPVEAKAALDRALAIEPANRDYLYHQALLLHHAGKNEEAATQLRALLQQQQPFAERNEAEALLRRLEAGR